MSEIAKRVQVSYVIKNEHKRLITAVVYQPDTRDLQDDFATADVIQEAAHEFLADHRIVKVMHTGGPQNVDVVESFTAPEPFVMENGTAVKKGAWVVVLKVHDDVIWGKVKSGEFKGISMGGLAERIPDRQPEQAA